MLYLHGLTGPRAIDRPDPRGNTVDVVAKVGFLGRRRGPDAESRARDQPRTPGVIIANGAPTGRSIVTVRPTDVAFQSSRCGDWTLLDALPVPGEVTYLEDYDEVTGAVIDLVYDNLDPSKPKNALRRDAKPIAAQLREVLLSVTPERCYVDDYAALWRLYGSLWHLAEWTAGPRGISPYIADLGAHNEAIEDAYEDC